jgi:hypothetical protein
MRDGAIRTSAPGRPIARGTVGQVVGQTATAYRLRLPDGTIGYVDQPAVVPADTPWRRERLPPGMRLRELPSETAPVIDALDQSRQVDVLGEFGGFRLVRVDAALEGWVAAREAGATIGADR